jgi:DNA-dependent RNA polymerase auxiliary subunit epsilon
MSRKVARTAAEREREREGERERRVRQQLKEEEEPIEFVTVFADLPPSLL